jgi:hypothetical protein
MLPLITELVSFGLIDDKQGNLSVNFHQLYRVLRLKYLNLQSIRRSHKDIMSRLTHDAKNRAATYLKQLIMMKFECEFDNLIQILKRTQT